MFTQDQINFISQLIDERIERQARPDHENGQNHDFHTIFDIRDLIVANLKEFRAFCSGEDFHISMLIIFLKMKTDLTECDKQNMPQGKNRFMTRFEKQVQSVFTNWHDAPIERAARRGYYRFVNLRQTQP